MNYIISLLITSIIILFLYSKHLYEENNILIENEKLIISGYEITIQELEKKANFEKEILTQKETVIKANEKVIIENEKRGAINESDTNSDFVITSF